MRDWLDDHGIDRATLLVVPAPDLHPLRRPRRRARRVARRAPAGCGDAIAQHGLRDRCEWRTRWSPATPFTRAPRPDAEFAGLDADETRRAVDSGWRILRLAGLEPTGFVAPAYAYTPGAARHASPRRFALVGRDDPPLLPDGPAQGTATGPLLAVNAAGRVRRLAGPVDGARPSRVAGRVLRLDLKPSDLESRRHVAALERVLLAARDRVPVTLDEVASSAPRSRAEAP